MSIFSSITPRFFQSKRIPVSSIPKRTQVYLKNVAKQPLSFVNHRATTTGTSLGIIAGVPWAIASWFSKTRNFKRAFAAVGVTTGGLLFWQGHNAQKNINTVIDATAPYLKKNATVQDLINYMGIR